MNAKRVREFADNYAFLWTLAKEILAVLMVPTIGGMLWLYSNVQANSEFRNKGDRYTLEQAEKDRSESQRYARAQAAEVRAEVNAKLDRIDAQNIQTIRQLERLSALLESRQ